MVLQQALNDGGNGNRVSSIGATWPPGYDANNRRIKGICTTTVRSPSKLIEIFHKVQEVERENPQATRTTFRVFASKTLAETIRHDSASTYKVEAIVPADYAVEGCSLVYFGRNAPERNPGEELRLQEIDILHKVLSVVTPTEPDRAMARISANGYNISMLNGQPPERDIQDLIGIYKEAYQIYTFPVNEATVQYMIGNGNRVFVARANDGEHGGRIASVVIAEHCPIQMEDGRVVNLFELSDFATYQHSMKKGLNIALQFEAVRAIRSTPDGENAIIYTEDRAPWYAVNKSSREAGFEYCGTLHWHCNLVSYRDIAYENTLESLNVFHVPRQ